MARRKHQPAMEALVHEYLEYRRTLGYELKVEGQELLRFARYADEFGHRGPVTTELAVRWAKLPARGVDHVYWARRLDVVRRFAQQRQLFDPKTEVPPIGLLGPAYRRRPAPHIYSDAEVADLLAAAAQLGPAEGLRPHTYVTLFGLLACTGMRIGEALSLERADVDFQRALIRVHSSKFQKSRLLPVRPSTVDALQSYVEHRDRYHPATSCGAFFLTEKGTSLKYNKVAKTFHSIRRSLGWTTKNTGFPPRIHDLRHRFAVKRLTLWYEEGAEIDRMILALSTYVGHVKVTDTYWYLTAVPELMAIVSARFEGFTS